jgi:hypothetical protein
MPAAPRRYLAVAARRLPATVASLKYLIVVPRPLAAAPFLVRRRYLIVVPRPLPAAPLAVRRTYMIVVLRPVLRLLPAATRHFLIRRRPLGRCSQRQGILRQGGIVRRSFGRTYVIVVPRPVPAAVVCHRYLIVVPKPLPAAPFLVRRSSL